MNPPIRPDYFYKYMTAEAATAVLSSKSLRWRSPLTFNDPFDNQLDILINEDPQVFMEDTISFLFSLLTSPSPVTGMHTDDWNHEFEKVRQHGVVQGPAYIADYIAGMIPTLSKRLPDMIASMPEYNRRIKGHLSVIRILCLTTDNANLTMWSHYTNSHRGIVIKLSPKSSVSFLSKADGVVYSETQRVFTATDILNHESMITKGAGYIVYTKGADWAYEKEWRAVKVQQNKTQDFDDFEFDAKDLEAVYLGCRIEPSDKTSIIEIIRTNFPHADIYQATAHPSQFALMFDKV